MNRDKVNFKIQQFRNSAEPVNFFSVQPNLNNILINWLHCAKIVLFKMMDLIVQATKWSIRLTQKCLKSAYASSMVFFVVKRKTTKTVNHVKRQTRNNMVHITFPLYLAIQLIFTMYLRQIFQNCLPWPETKYGFF